MPRTLPAFRDLKLLARAARGAKRLPEFALTHKPTAELLSAAVRLAILALRAGSRIDVYAYGEGSHRFWEACVLRIEDGIGVHFCFVGAEQETGYVRFDEYLARWRLPVAHGSAARKASDFYYYYALCCEELDGHAVA